MNIMLPHEVVEAKQLYMNAKLGISHVCNNCRTEIYQSRFQGWLHKRPGFYEALPCWNDPADGMADPMSDSDLADWFEEIMENDDSQTD